MAFMVVFHRCLRNTESTGKSPDPLYLCAGNAIHPMLHIKESGTETRLYVM